MKKKVLIFGRPFRAGAQAVARWIRRGIEQESQAGDQKGVWLWNRKRPRNRTIWGTRIYRS